MDKTIHSTELLPYIEEKLEQDGFLDCVGREKISRERILVFSLLYKAYSDGLIFLNEIEDHILQPLAEVEVTLRMLAEERRSWIKGKVRYWKGKKWSYLPLLEQEEKSKESLNRARVRDLFMSATMEEIISFEEFDRAEEENLSISDAEIFIRQKVKTLIEAGELNSDRYWGQEYWRESLRQEDIGAIAGGIVREIEGACRLMH